jgi:hypothetical protein
MTDRQVDGCGLNTDVVVGGNDDSGGGGVKSNICSNCCVKDGGINNEVSRKPGLRLTEGSAVRTLQRTDSQSRKSSAGNRQSLVPEPTLDPPVLDHLQAPSSQSQSEGLELTLSQSSRERRHKKLSRAQSLVQVALENQREKIVPLRAWTVDTGQWGGRIPDTPGAWAAASANRSLQPAERPTTLQAWMSESETSPFSVRPPESIIQSVQATLKQDNARLANK